MRIKPTGRYRLPAGIEIEHQPGSGARVLANKLGIASKRKMDKAEYEALIRAQENWLVNITPRTRFTAALIRGMHRDWLGGLYMWAGEYRTVNLSKAGFTWPPAIRVPANMETFEQGVLSEHTPCLSSGLHDIARRIGIVHGELLLIHPFREGNGRLARWLAELMAYQAGLPRPNYRFAGRGSTGRFGRYINAVRKAYLEDYADLTDFFVEALEAGLERETRA
ncbi:Fic family protein [Candidatus Sumerlaeota bacterium]|nr:Fic family protein [Candidatus Sumerlaeota bacterium]